MFALKKPSYYIHPEKEVINSKFAAYPLKEYVGPVITCPRSQRPEAVLKLSQHECETATLLIVR